MKNSFKCILLGILSLTFFFACAIQGQVLSSDKGTLIVTYQTDQMGQRLDRIRFWLINEKQERTLYPKKDEFVTHHQTQRERTVVITHLSIGHYRIEFLVPNTDHFFKEVPPHEVNVEANAIVKIDQTISPHPSPQDSTPSESNELATVIINNPPPPPYPNRFNSFSRPLVPFPLGKLPHFATFALATNFNYKGSLQVTTDNSQALFTLATENESIIGQGQGYSYPFTDLAPGRYLLNATSSNSHLFAHPPSQQITIRDNRTSKINVHYQPIGRLTIHSKENFQITIQSTQDKKIILQETISAPLHTLQVPNGRYILTYRSLTHPHAQFKPIEITVCATDNQALDLPFEESALPSDVEDSLTHEQKMD